MQSADLTLRLPQSMQPPVPDGVDAGLHREEVLLWDVDPEAETVSTLSLIVGDIEASQTVTTDLDGIHRYDVTPVDGERFYCYAETDFRSVDSSVFGAFDIPGLVIVPPLIYTDPASVNVTVLGESDALSDIFERLPEKVGVDVERVTEHRRRAETLAGRLTNRQFEALSIARELGYYEVPREANLASVANRLGCSESGASQLLRSAERQLVDAAV